jgi:hypothetical protein
VRAGIGGTLVENAEVGVAEELRQKRRGIMSYTNLLRSRGL